MHDKESTKSSKIVGFFAKTKDLLKTPSPQIEELTLATFEGNRRVICHIWEERNGNWGHASLQGENFYLSLWPKFGASSNEKNGKIIPSPAVLSSYKTDCESEGESYDKPRDPDHSIIINLSNNDYSKVSDFYKQIENKVESGIVKYCAANCNLPFYGEKGVKAYNCTGVVQHALLNTNFGFKQKLIMTPSELATEFNSVLNPKILKIKTLERAEEIQYLRNMSCCHY